MNKIQDDEISQKMPSLEEALREKSFRALVVYGKKGSGHQALTELIFNRILADRTLGLMSQKLCRKDICRVAYENQDQESESPYKAFAELERIMKRRRRLFSIFHRLLRLVLSIVSVLDPIDELKELANEIKQSGEKEDIVREKELKLFRQFTRAIERHSRKKPLLVAIGNAQWMDRSSCQLLGHLLRESASFWGLMVLEYSTDELTGNHAIDSSLWDLIKEGTVNTIKAKLLDASYFERYQKDKFGRILFSGDDAERVIGLARETPSRLDELIESWTFQKLIYKENGEWTKSKSLRLNELTTREEKLIELCKVFLRDSVLTPKEEEALYAQAQSLGFPDEQVDQIRMLARFEALNPQYHIVRRVRSGTIGDIFKGFDKERNRDVFIEIDQRLQEAQADSPDTASIRSASLLNTLEVHHADNFNFIVTEYTRGTTLEDLRPEYIFFDFRKTYAIAKNLLSAISLLHRKNYIHGNIRPDKVFVEDDGSVKVGGIGFIKNLRYDIGKGLAFDQKSTYSSPEHIRGEGLSLQSDVFSLGALIYELFTGQIPFSGENEKQVADAILSNPIKPSRYLDDHGDLKAILYKALDKNDQVRSSSAESLNIAFDHIDHPDHRITAKAASHRPEKRPAWSVWSSLKWVLVPVLIIGFVIGGWKLVQKSSSTDYEKGKIVINEFSYDKRVDLPKGIVEYLLQRSLLAMDASKLTISIVPLSKKAKKEHSEFVISGAVDAHDGGYDVNVIFNVKGRIKKTEMHCSGHSGLLDAAIVKLPLFLFDESGGQIARLTDDKSARAVFTAMWDASEAYYEARAKWDKIETQDAIRNFRKAIGIDPTFALAKLGLAEVLIWDSQDNEAARLIAELKKGSDNLIPTDRLLCEALEKRLQAKPYEERDLLDKLAGQFPTEKKYFYYMAESYFHYGDADKALKYYREALDLEYNFNIAHNHAGYCYAWKGDHSSAEKEFTEYVALDRSSNSYDSLASGYMFAGRYEDAIEACRKGLEVKQEDFLYSNMASNLLLLGKIGEAIKNWSKNIELTEKEVTKVNSMFWQGFAEYLGGDNARSRTLIDKARQFYSSPEYDDDLKDGANLPIWLEGLIAFNESKQGVLELSIKKLESKVTRHKVNFDVNYQRVLKYSVHLQALRASLTKNPNELLRLSEEILQNESKLGYWSSILNSAYFFNQYASLLLNSGGSREWDLAEKLLAKAEESNSHYPQTYLNLARASLGKKDVSKARLALKQAKELLKGSDPGYVLLKQLKELEEEANAAAKLKA